MERTKPVPPDGLWIGVLGSKGFVGMTLIYLSLVLPAALFVRRFPAKWWGDPRVAAASLAAAFMGLYLIDCLLNAFVNIIYISLAGGLAGLDPRQLRAMGATGRGPRRRAVGLSGGPPGRPRTSARRPPPARPCWRTAAAPWAGRSSWTGGWTRPMPPGVRPSTCSPP